MELQAFTWKRQALFAEGLLEERLAITTLRGIQYFKNTFNSLDKPDKLVKAVRRFSSSGGINNYIMYSRTHRHHR